MADLYGLLIRVLITVWCYFVFVMGCIVWGGLGIPLTLLLSRFWPSARDRFHDGTQRVLRRLHQTPSLHRARRRPEQEARLRRIDAYW